MMRERKKESKQDKSIKMMTRQYVINQTIESLQRQPRPARINLQSLNGCGLEVQSCHTDRPVSHFSPDDRSVHLVSVTQRNATINTLPRTLMPDAHS